MRFIDQKQPVAGRIKEPFQVHHRIEEVIVIPNDHIAPLAQVKPQLKGTHRKTLCRPGQRCAVQTAGTVQQSCQCILDAVVVAVGVGAKLRQAGGMSLCVRVQADLFLGGQRHTAQGKLWLGRMQPCQGILGGSLGRVAGREIEQLFSAAFAHSFQRGEKCAHGLANAGRSLTEQPRTALAVGGLASAAGTVDLARHSPLTGPILRKRELQCRKALSTLYIPLYPALRPRSIPAQ